jgi:Cu+-exporting ATPase
LLAGARFYRGAWAALRHRRADMNTLIALGTTAAFLVSAFVTIAPAAARALGIPPHTYFDTSTAILTLVLLGKWLEARARRRTGSALAALLAFRPERARIERGGAVLEVAAAEVREGDVFVLRPGDRVPVDGVVIDGPVERRRVLADGREPAAREGQGCRACSRGSLNVEGALRARALARGGADRARPGRALRARGPGFARADPGAGGPGGGRVRAGRARDRRSPPFATWMAVDPPVALARTVAVLVIACPCALWGLPRRPRWRWAWDARPRRGS